MKKLSFVVLVSFLVIIFVLPNFVCAASDKDTIKIGLMYPLTGPLATTGFSMRNGAMFAFEQAGFTVAGKKIEVVVEDSGTNPATSVDKAKKMVEKDKVCLIIGPIIGGAKMAVGGYMAKVGIPHIASTPSPLAMSRNKWSYMTNGSDPQQSSPMGVYAYEKMGLRKITVMTEDTIPGHSFLDAFIAGFKSRGGQVVQEQYTPFPCMDFAPFLGALKDADALVAWYVGIDAIKFHSQFHALGIKKRMPLVAGFWGGFMVESITKNLKPNIADGLVGVLLPGTYSRLLDNEVNKKFVKGFKSKYDDPPEDVISDYVAASVVLKALEATKGDTTPAKLGKAILNVNFECPLGTIRFNKKTRFAVKNTHIMKLDKRGKNYLFDPVYVYEDVPLEGYK